MVNEHTRTAAAKTARVLSAFHFFLYCEEVEFDTLCRAFSVSKRTARRDIRLLERAGVLEARFDRSRRAFVAERLGPLPMAPETNRTRLRYLNKIRRLCLLMAALDDTEETEDDPAALYRRLFPEARDRTRQRDFAALRELGYVIGGGDAEADGPGRGHVEIPPAFCLSTIPDGVSWR